MRIFYLTFFSVALLFNGSSQVQDWSWARSGSGNGREVVTDQVTDSQGNTYMVGHFSGNITFSNTTLTNANSGTSDIFIVKFSPGGFPLWAISAGSNNNEEARSVAMDGSGNLYVTGFYESATVNFGTHQITNGSSLPDIFVVKLNTSGNVIWAKGFGGPLLDVGNRIAVDAAGNTYLTGEFQSIGVLFGAHGVANSGSSTSDAFIVKFDPSGTSLWAKQIGGSLTEIGTALSIDPNGNVLVAGAYNSAVLNSYSVTVSGGFDIFLGKYNSNGSLLSVATIGGSAQEFPYAVEYDNAGNLYLALTFNSNSVNLGSVTYNSIGSSNLLLVKYNSAMSVQWAKQAIGNLYTLPNTIHLTGNDVYLGGSFDAGTLTFGNSSVTNSSNNASDAFVARFSASGNEVWLKSFGGSGDEEVIGISADNAGNIYAGGNFSSLTSLGANTLTVVNDKEVFLARLCVLPSTPVAGSSLTICPGTVGTLSATPPQGASINWYSAAGGGTLLLPASNTFTTFTPGTYYAEAGDQFGCVNPSRVAVSLSVHPGITVSINGKTLSAGPPGGKYQWFECVKDSVMSAQTNANYTLTQTGHYAVVVTANGCVDTSACNFYSVDVTTGTVTITGVDDNRNDNDRLLVFPNPANEEFTVQSGEPSFLVITNVLGEQILSVFLTRQTNFEMKIKIEVPGIYFVADPQRHLMKTVVVY